MKRILYLFLSLVILALNSCKSDEPQESNEVGYLTLNLIQEDATENTDFSDYKIFIMSENGGFGWETPYKEISWPVSRPAGEYIVIAESPLVFETETTRFFYTAMERNVLIVKDRTTELTLTLKLNEFTKE